MTTVIDTTTTTTTTKKFMNGCVNYPTHESAKLAFHLLDCPAALDLHADGEATITILQSEPMYNGQHEFIGTPKTIYHL